MKIIYTIIILIFPIIGNLLIKFINKEFTNIYNFIFDIPPFNIITAIETYYGKDNIEINYNDIFKYYIGLFLFGILSIFILFYFSCKQNTKIVGGTLDNILIKKNNNFLNSFTNLDNNLKLNSKLFYI